MPEVSIEAASEGATGVHVALDGLQLHPMWLRERCTAVNTNKTSKLESGSVQGGTMQPLWQPHEFRSNMTVTAAETYNMGGSVWLACTFSDGHKSLFDVASITREVQSVARTENEKILATNASSEAPLERQKMIILFMKIRLLSLQSRAICN